MLKNDLLRQYLLTMQVFSRDPSYTAAKFYLPPCTVVPTDFPKSKTEIFYYCETTHLELPHQLQIPNEALFPISILISMLTQTRKPIVAFNLDGVVKVTWFYLKDHMLINEILEESKTNTITISPTNNYLNEFAQPDETDIFYRTFVNFTPKKQNLENPKISKPLHLDFEFEFKLDTIFICSGRAQMAAI